VIFLNNNCPYTFAIKQIVCQGGVSKRFDNTYTNTPVGSEIPLSIGYVLTFIRGTCKNCTVRISNPLFIPDINFNILNESFKVFDLPCECGTYRLHIAARLAPVETFCNVN
jgi:hypothetical protein